MRSWSIIFPFFLILVLMFSLPFIKCSASAAPFWLREGVYACYEFEFNPMDFGNGTLIWYANGTYGWECLGVSGDTAIFEITVNITGRKLGPEYKKTPYNFTAKYVINIDIETREAFFGDEYLGILPYWIPADVEKLPYIDEERLPDWMWKKEWKVIENFTSFDNLTTYGLVGNVSREIETPYKTFKGDELLAIVGAFDPLTGFTYIYEKDSGLWITMGLMDNFWRKVIGAQNKSFNLLLRDTNVHFSPEPTSPITFLLPYIISATAITAATAYIYFTKIRKKSQSITHHCGKI